VVPLLPEVPVFGFLRRKPTHYYHVFHESLEGGDGMDCIVSNLELAGLLAGGDRVLVNLAPAIRAAVEEEVASAV
jgi:hypothetical protein